MQRKKSMECVELEEFALFKFKVHVRILVYGLYNWIRSS